MMLAHFWHRYTISVVFVAAAVATSLVVIAAQGVGV